MYICNSITRFNIGFFKNQFVTIMEKYKTKIKQKGLKLNWVAMQLTVSRPTLSAYLAGTRTMPMIIESKLKDLLR